MIRAVSGAFGPGPATGVALIALALGACGSSTVSSSPPRGPAHRSVSALTKRPVESGSGALDTILAWQPGRPARAVGHLPEAVRYAAVAASGSRLLVAGGTVAGAPCDWIFSFDPSTGAVTRIGRLPYPLTHATAATL